MVISPGSRAAGERRAPGFAGVGAAELADGAGLAGAAAAGGEAGWLGAEGAADSVAAGGACASVPELLKTAVASAADSKSQICVVFMSPV